jgi:GNAT superfamily N-acetyltransferase
MTLKQIYFTHTSSKGVIYNARPMPEEFKNIHVAVLHNTDSGTAIRVYIIDPNEERKFVGKINKQGIYVSDDGEQGYIGYYDYNLEEDGSVTSRAFYIHPQHRGRGIMKDLLLFIEEIAEEGTIYNDHIITNPIISEVVDDIISRGKGAVTYRKGYK